MYLKLIIKNVVKNVKDYGIYFLTLLISVATFYSFNSIESQPVIKAAAQDEDSLMGSLLPLIGLASVVVAIVLAFLIIYANQFLLKRRKRELGIYMILGMSERKMSGIFIGETVLIGIMALVFGIGLGTLVSQGLSVFAIKMFNYDMSGYEFSFSVSALKKTVICFAIIFVAVMIFNVINITKVKLIDLLTASRRNEKMAVEKTGMFVIVFLCSLILYGVTGYILYFKNGLSVKSSGPAICVASLSLATAMLIYSISGVVIKLLQKNKKWYLKSINCFLTRQISSKIQTNYITMTVVSLLLTGTICIISVGMGMADSMNETVDNATPFDVMIMKTEPVESEQAYYDDLQTSGMELDQSLTDQVILMIRNDESLLFREVLSDTENTAQVVKNSLDKPIDIISISDYNDALRIRGKDEIVLEEGHYLINNYFNASYDNLQAKYAEKPAISVAGESLVPGTDEVLKNLYFISAVGMNDMGSIIVPDSVAEKLTIDSEILLGIQNQNYEYNRFMENVKILWGDELKSPYYVITNNMIKDAYYGTFAMGAFITVYIGVVLLIICVALLSLQQLTETNDNIHRYQLLGKLGVERKVQNSVLLKQILMYFGVPLVVATGYALVGMPKIVDKIKNSLAMEVGTKATVIIVVMVLIYGSYFLITYLSCRRMIAEKRDRMIED